MRIDFYLRFTTSFGQSLFISGNVPALGSDLDSQLFPLQYQDQDFWHSSVEVDPAELKNIHYRYLLLDENGELIREAEKERTLQLKRLAENVVVIDTWNDQALFENAFFTAPFKEVFFPHHKKTRTKKPDHFSHIIKVKAPLLSANETICILGSDPLGNWNSDNPLLLQKSGDWFNGYFDLSAAAFPLFYKYGVYNTKNEEFVCYENGDNRVLHNFGSDDEKTTVVHDSFVRLPNDVWKAAGVAIPVFSLRSNNSFGVGEFVDLKLLVDWAKQTGIRLIQILPVNDTSATHTWKDSYPYAAISAFGLHPLYLNLQKVAGKKFADKVKALAKKQKQLNALAEVDYEQVMHFKISMLREIYEAAEMSFLQEADYKSFFEENKNWLVPYAAFCFLRDKYGTSDFYKWKSNSVYNEDEIERLSSPRSRAYFQVAFHYFLQYHLHLQLKDAVDYAHKNGIAFKGDIPIGIYRYGCDAWTAPELYNMEMQAGAPPDDFTIKGQNWGFPTYNWKRMEADHFEWWRQRFHQMSNYFDAFRIDHILGFFRIWSIPVDSVEGIVGRFIPALPVTVHEFGERGIWFDYDRLCKPYITDQIIDQLFGADGDRVKETFLVDNNRGGYDLREEFNTQKKVDEYFSNQNEGENGALLKQGLFDLITNVILFERPDSDRQQFDFRISIENISSYQQLDDNTKGKLYELYINYFFRRQDDFWEKEAMKKLPALKEATNMLVCGEDLGMVPHSVPKVMKSLGILSLEIQRMPKDINLQFFHPKDAPYLSVVTPSTHDMSTVRGWWEEDRERTQQFFTAMLGEQSAAPYFCEPWVNRAIVLQHLYSPAMWSIFQLQDLLGMSDSLRRENPAEERINDPANPNHYWNYRMHIPLEQLIKEKEFNSELKDYVKNSGRG